MLELGLDFIGVVADGKFSSQKAVEFHLEQNINFLGRIKSNRIVEYNGGKLNLNELAENFHLSLAISMSGLGGDLLESPFNWQSQELKF